MNPNGISPTGLSKGSSQLSGLSSSSSSPIIRFGFVGVFPVLVVVVVPVIAAIGKVEPDVSLAARLEALQKQQEAMMKAQQSRKK